MEIHSGLFSHMVMQRDGDDCCNQTVTGRAEAEVPLRMQMPSGQILPLGKTCPDGYFRFQLQGLPAGGPYSLTLHAGTEQMAFEDILVGDVWMLAGQSNMEGYAYLKNAAEPDCRIRLYGMDDTWSIAREPLHELDKANAEIHWELRGGREAHRLFQEMQQQSGSIPASPRGCGPGLYFAREMLRHRQIPQGLIASAHGGTTMEQWNPELRDKGNLSLYGAMYQRFLHNGAPRLAGLLWYQGCSDAEAGMDAVAHYEERTRILLNAVRRDFSSPELPVILVQIGRYADPATAGQDLCWSAVREAQRRLADACPGVLMPGTLDLEYDDDIHLSGKSHRRLAARMADAVEFLCSHGTKGAAPIQLENAMHTMDPDTRDEQVVLTFRNVRGSLHADGGLPLGFSLHRTGAEHTACPAPFRTDLQENTVILHYTCHDAVKVAYGFGANPPANIHDDAGQTLPAFGPVYFQNICRMTPLLLNAECSEPLFGDDSYDAILPAAERLASCRFHPCRGAAFYLAPQRFQGNRPYIYFLRWKVRCGIAASCLALLGSDGPFRLFCDGREIGGNASAGCPLLLDKYRYPLELAAGEHEFSLGLSGKRGYTWGISFRIALPDTVMTSANETETDPRLPVFVSSYGSAYYNAETMSPTH